MSTSDDIRPAARALEIAESRPRDTAAHDALRLIDELDTHPCVAFVVGFEGSYEYSPGIDVAVRLLCGARAGVIDNMIPHLQPDQATPEALAAASRIVNECVAALNNSGEPYALLLYVHGESEVQLHHGAGCTWEAALQELQHSIGNEVTFMV